MFGCPGSDHPIFCWLRQLTARLKKQHAEIEALREQLARKNAASPGPGPSDFWLRLLPIANQRGVYYAQLPELMKPTLASRIVTFNFQSMMFLTGSDESFLQVECDRLRSQVEEMKQFMAETLQQWSFG